MAVVAGTRPNQEGVLWSILIICPQSIPTPEAAVLMGVATSIGGVLSICSSNHPNGWWSGPRALWRERLVQSRYFCAPIFPAFGAALDH